MKRAILGCCIIATVTTTATPAANEAYVLFTYFRSKHTQAPLGGGIWLGSSAAGAYTRLWGQRGTMVDGAWFHPDGKTIAFSYGGMLYIMNNDGTDPKRHDPGEHWNPRRDLWQYTDKGIFWFKDTTDELYRFDPSSGITTHIPVELQGAPRTQLRLSNDATKGFIIQYTPTICGGNKAIASSPALERFAAYTLAPLDDEVPPYIQPCDGPWGHGNCVTPDGQYVLMNSWCCVKGGCPGSGSHTALNVYRLSDGTQLRSVCPSPTAVSMYNWEVPEAVVNSSDHVIVAWGNNYNQGSYQCFMINWTNPDERLAVPMPHACTVQNGWLGPLPSPYDDKPYIMPTSRTLYCSAAGDTTCTRTMTISNIGDGTLESLTTTIDPPSTSWLSVDTEGGGGNTQTLVNTITTTGLSDGEYRATVTVSGGGASNENSYSVILIKGEGYIAAPSELDVSLGGDSLLAVSLSWTDNASNEEGYAVQRRSVGGTWAETSRTTATNAVVKHTHDELGPYEYRVQAYRDDGASSWSVPATVTVTGIEWIRVTSPDVHHWVAAGSVVTITWESNRVFDAAISYSTDGGANWRSVLEGASIGSADPHWRSYPWNVPSGLDADSVIIMVHKYGEPDIAALSGIFTVSSSSWPGLKVNCGSNAHEAPGWVADDRFLQQPAQGEYTWQEPITMTGENLAPAGVYRTNVYGTSRTYHFPFVPDGEHTLRLHHVVHRDYYMSYDVDATTVLSDYNPREQCGVYTACVKELRVTVSDGNGMTLRSYSGRGDAIENGIEIIPVELYTGHRPPRLPRRTTTARTIDVHTLQGRLIRRIPAERWNPRFLGRAGVGSGVYVVRILNNGRSIGMHRITATVSDRREE